MAKKKAKPLVVKIGKYACVVCRKTAKGPIYCCGPSITKLHLPKRMAKK